MRGFEELDEVIPPRLGRDFAVELAEKRLDAVLFCFQDVMVSMQWVDKLMALASWTYLFVLFFTQAKFSENKIYTENTVNCQFTQ